MSLKIRSEDWIPFVLPDFFQRNHSRRSTNNLGYTGSWLKDRNGRRNYFKRLTRSLNEFTIHLDVSEGMHTTDNILFFSTHRDNLAFYWIPQLLMEKLNIKEKYLKKLRDNGYLGYSREGDKYWYTQEDVDRFLRRFHYEAFAIGDELPKQEGGGYV